LTFATCNTIIVTSIMEVRIWTERERERESERER